MTSKRKHSPINSTNDVDHEESQSMHFRLNSDEDHLLHPDELEQQPNQQGFEPTSKEEIRAWCFYEFASYPASSLSVTLLFPILIESLVKSEQDQKKEIFFLGLQVESAVIMIIIIRL